MTVRLDWPGKSAAAARALTPTPARLEPPLPVGHAVVEGDNLDVLKLLQHDHAGRVDLIYLDPPYNTGRASPYRDRFGSSAAWLDMMLPRLVLCRDLLSPRGAVFASIDDAEAAHLRTLLDEVFGDQVVGTISVVNNWKGRSDHKLLATAHESLIYVRGTDHAPAGLPLPPEVRAAYDKGDDQGPFRLLGLRKRGSAARAVDRPNLHFPLWIDPVACTVAVAADAAHHVQVLPRLSTGEAGRWRWGKDSVAARRGELVARQVTRARRWDVFQVDRPSQDGAPRRVRPKSVWQAPGMTSDAGTRELKALLGDVGARTPKPLALLRTCLELVPDDALVLDPFAGTGSTGHAVVLANAEDRGTRRCILVQSPEPAPPRAVARGLATWAAVCRARLQAVGLAPFVAVRVVGAENSV